MYKEILSFWFDELKESQWWAVDSALDKIITDRFSSVHELAIHCELFEWRNTPRGRLAEIIVLDQFSRNMFRGQPQSFAHDPLALALSQEAIAMKADAELGALERCFLYMPFMHSESLAIHNVATELFTANGLQSNIDFELQHKRIIERFGRYPHRNTILGRESTREENEFLALPGSSF